MLVLTRRIFEKIRINDDIVITLLGVRGNQYKIGIEAPRDVKVHREEIWQRIRADEIRAGNAENIEKTEEDVMQRYSSDSVSVVNGRG